MGGKGGGGGHVEAEVLEFFDRDHARRDRNRRRRRLLCCLLLLQLTPACLRPALQKRVDGVDVGRVRQVRTRLVADRVPAASVPEAVLHVLRQLRAEPGDVRAERRDQLPQENNEAIRWRDAVRLQLRADELALGAQNLLDRDQILIDLRRRGGSSRRSVHCHGLFPQVLVLDDNVADRLGRRQRLVVRNHHELGDFGAGSAAVHDHAWRRVLNIRPVHLVVEVPRPPRLVDHCASREELRVSAHTHP